MIDKNVQFAVEVARQARSVFVCGVCRARAEE
jgi:hypothetical protein